MLRFLRCSSLVALGLTLTLGACSSPTGPSQTLTLLSEDALDGWVTSSGLAVVIAGGPLTGDSDATTPGVGYRQFYSFDLSTLPSGAQVTMATLRLYQASVKGRPYGVLGNAIVDHVNIGPVLVGADYGGGTIASNIGTLSTNATLEYKSVDVTSALQDDLSSSRSHSQYRLRFSIKDSNNDGVNDFASFTDAEDSCCAVNKPPQLIIVYHQ